LLVLQRRYPFAEVGRLAAIEFAIAGAVAGVITGLEAGGSTVVTYAVLFAALAGMISLIVYSSQGAQRPASVAQASSADGVVSGILTGFFCALIVAIAASGHVHTPTTGQIILGFILSALAGGVIGGLLGLLLVALAGRERLTRIPPTRKERRKQASVTGKKRRR
jgi:hypothetical protein